MTREEYIKKLIRDNGFTIKEYAEQINMPYSTLLTMLNQNKIGVASIENVIKICHGLSITIEDLQESQSNDFIPSNKIVLSSHEKEIITKYREKIDLQKAIDILLLGDS